MIDFAAVGHEGRHWVYEAPLAPRLWHASRRADFRIWQNQTVPDILYQVLGENAVRFDMRLKARYKRWTYPITHTMDQSQQCSPNVFLQGKAVYLHNESFVDNVKGDEPGAGKGVVSGTHTTISHNIDKSSNVYVNGRPIVRTGDSMWMNWKSMGPAAPSPKTPVSTGLGESVDDLVGKSPTLEADIEKLKESGWEIEYGAPGKGSYAWREGDPPLIVLDGNLKGDPEQAVQVLPHEVGHATYTYTPDYSSNAAYVNGALAGEGAATMKNIQIQREILANGGPDIGIAGTPANHAGYNAAYDA